MKILNIISSITLLLYCVEVKVLRYIFSQRSKMSHRRPYQVTIFSTFKYSINHYLFKNIWLRRVFHDTNIKVFSEKEFYEIISV